MIVRALAIVALLLAGGCGVSATEAPTQTSTGEPPVSSIAPAPARPRVLPTAVQIPSIGASSSLVPLGLTADGALDVPPVTQPGQAGYYAGARRDWLGDEVLPGEVGPAVLVGHVDGVINGQKGQPGVFYRLHELTPGAEIFVQRADGSRLRFVVQRVERHDKDVFPTAAVYGDTLAPELRLITCGGEFDRSVRSYKDNVIVWAVLA